MPISLNHLKNDVRSCTVNYGGESAQVTYRPSVLTPASNAQRKQASEEGDTNVGVAMLCEMLISWEVMDDADPPKPVPITPETLSQLPDPLLTAVLNACREDMYPNPKTGRK